MPAPAPVTDEQIAEAIKANSALPKPRSLDALAGILGVGRRRVAAVKEGRGSVGTPLQVPTVPLPDPALTRAAEAMKAAAHQPPDEAAAEWQELKARAKRTLTKAREGSSFRLAAPGRHLLLSMVSDQHIGASHTDYDAMQADAELIRDTPNCFAVLGGDGIDNAIKHRASVLMNTTAPETQFLCLDYYLRILGDKAVIGVGGNHEAWTVAFAGVDVLGRVLKANRVFYNPGAIYVDVGVGTQSYTVAVRHQYRLNSSFNQTHAVKQWLRLGAREFDIGVISHNHEHALESFVYRGRLCWGCRPGSYQITSGYGEQYGYNASIPTTPTFLLRGDRKEIIGFPTLRMAIDATRAMRELGAA